MFSVKSKYEIKSPAISILRRHIGRKYIHAVFMLLVVIAASAARVAAQTSLTTGNPQQPITIIQTVISIVVWAMVALSIGGLCWGAANGMRDKAWGNQIAWSIVGFGISGFIAMFYTIGSGNSILLPTL